MAEQGMGQGSVETPLDTSRLTTTYANWYQVTGTPEELILDFALSPNLGVVTAHPVRLEQRVVMSFYTAKRLLTHLHYAVKRYENIFGPLEIDIPTRVQALSSGRKAA